MLPHCCALQDHKGSIVMFHYFDSVLVIVFTLFGIYIRLSFGSAKSLVSPIKITYKGNIT